MTDLKKRALDIFKAAIVERIGECQNAWLGETSGISQGHRVWMRISEDEYRASDPPKPDGEPPPFTIDEPRAPTGKRPVPPNGGGAPDAIKKLQAAVDGYDSAIEERRLFFESKAAHQAAVDEYLPKRERWRRELQSRRNREILSFLDRENMLEAKVKSVARAFVDAVVVDASRTFIFAQCGEPKIIAAKSEIVFIWPGAIVRVNAKGS